MNSTELRGYLTGLILGDGTIDKGVTKRAFRIKSINIDFIYKISEDLSNTNFDIEVREFPSTSKSDAERKAYAELTIKAHPYFNKIYHYFYDDFRNRRIHPEVLNWLTPKGWANWYMSDGYIVKVGLTKGKIVDRRVELATDAYTKKEVNLIRKHISEKYNYKTSIISRKRNEQYRIRISLLDAQHFLLEMEKHLVDSMRYKLNMAYDYQPKWMDDEYYKLMMLLQSAGRLVNPY